MKDGVDGSETGFIRPRVGGARGEATSSAGIVAVDDEADSVGGMSIFSEGVAETRDEFETFDRLSFRDIGGAAAVEGVRPKDCCIGGTAKLC